MQECRICLSEEPPLKPLGCNCKGTLRLVHVECATRWFTNQGRAVCEICHSQVVLPGAEWARRLRILAAAVAVVVMVAASVLMSLGIYWLESHF